MVGATEGLIYELSADGNYYEVVGYEGTATKVKIADTYNGLPVTTLDHNTFYQNKAIVSVTIPDSVASIGNYTFENCTNLTSVYYKGTKDSWNDVSIAVDNHYLKYAIRYYYSESEPTEEGSYWHYNEQNEIVIWTKNTL